MLRVVKSSRQRWEVFRLIAEFVLQCLWKIGLDYLRSATSHSSESTWIHSWFSLSSVDRPFGWDLSLSGSIDLIPNWTLALLFLAAWWAKVAPEVVSSGLFLGRGSLCLGRATLCGGPQILSVVGWGCLVIGECILLRLRWALLVICTGWLRLWNSWPLVLLKGLWHDIDFRLASIILRSPTLSEVIVGSFFLLSLILGTSESWWSCLNWSPVVVRSRLRWHHALFHNWSRSLQLLLGDHQLVHLFSLQRQLLPLHLDRLSLVLKLLVLFLILFANLLMILRNLFVQLIQLSDLPIIIPFQFLQTVLVSYGQLINLLVEIVCEFSLHPGYSIHLLLKLHLLHWKCGYLLDK